MSKPSKEQLLKEIKTLETGVDSKVIPNNIKEVMREQLKTLKKMLSDLEKAPKKTSSASKASTSKKSDSKDILDTAKEYFIDAGMIDQMTSDKATYTNALLKFYKKPNITSQEKEAIEFWDSTGVIVELKRDERRFVEALLKNARAKAGRTSSKKTDNKPDPVKKAKKSFWEKQPFQKKGDMEYLAATILYGDITEEEASGKLKDESRKKLFSALLDYLVNRKPSNEVKRKSEWLSGKKYYNGIEHGDMFIYFSTQKTCISDAAGWGAECTGLNREANDELKELYGNPLNSMQKSVIVNEFLPKQFDEFIDKGERSQKLAEKSKAQYEKAQSKPKANKVMVFFDEFEKWFTFSPSVFTKNVEPFLNKTKMPGGYSSYSPEDIEKEGWTPAKKNNTMSELRKFVNEVYFGKEFMSSKDKGSIKQYEVDDSNFETKVKEANKAFFKMIDNGSIGGKITFDSDTSMVKHDTGRGVTKYDINPTTYKMKVINASDDVVKSSSTKKSTGKVDYDCDELIEKEKEKAAKRKAAAKKADKKPEKKKNLDRTEKAVDITYDNLKERVDKGDRVTPDEVEKLISEYKTAIEKLTKLLNSLKKKSDEIVKSSPASIDKSSIADLKVLIKRLQVDQSVATYQRIQTEIEKWLMGYFFPGNQFSSFKGDLSKPLVRQEVEKFLYDLQQFCNNRLEVITKSSPAAAGWSGTMRSVKQSKPISIDFNGSTSAGYYDYSRDYLFAVKVSGGISLYLKSALIAFIEKALSNITYKYDLAPVGYMDNFSSKNSNDSYLDTKSGSSYTTIYMTQPYASKDGKSNYVQYPMTISTKEKFMK